MEMFNQVFKGKTVLVTGHTGFKGSWLSLWLLELGAKVIGYALDPYTEKDNFVVTDLSKKMVDIRGDVRDYQKLLSVIKIHKPEMIFHLAAQPLVRVSYLNPRETYETNIMGTVNVLEAVRQTNSVKVLMVITSDKCYENKEWLWGYRENDPMGGRDPYSSSKGSAELVISAYTSSFFSPDSIEKHGISVASVRAGNVIGGGDWAQDRLLPDCFKAFMENKPICVRHPQAIRPWQHVIDPLSGYLFLAKSMYTQPGRFEGAWNFGPDRDSCITVEELVSKVISFWGKQSRIEFSPVNNLHESILLTLDTSKSRFYLGWKPLFTINKAVELTVDWYKAFSLADIGDLYSINVKQIKQYWNLYQEQFHGSGDSE